MKNNETIRCNAKRPTAVRRFQLPRHILVVEDDIYILHLNLKGLAKAGYKVAAAHNGEVAWAALQVFTYDLVVTDNCMPNMSGVELLQKMRDAHINPPIMMATGALPENEFAAKPWLRPIAILIKPY
ncbi:MAG: response regulator transcription factor, partial [Limisphaerales bacterium]